MSEPIQFERLAWGAFQGLVLVNIVILADIVYYNPPYIHKGSVGFVSNHASVQQSKLPTTHWGYSRVQINDKTICW